MTQKIHWWTRGDLDGFFGLFTNSLANTLAALFLLTSIMGFPIQMILSQIVPGIVVSLAFGNIYFGFQAYRLGKKENRSDVTAVPYGLSVPHYFIVVFSIMLPFYKQNGDIHLAWALGVAWCFVQSVVVALGAFMAPTLRRLTPRAAMLGTLAGVSITFTALGPAFQTFEVAWIGLTSVGIIFIGWLAKEAMPFKIPAGLVAILLGIIIGWTTGYMSPAPLHQAVQDIGFYPPLLQLETFMKGLPLILPYLVSTIPLAIYLFMETLMNVESAEVAGDSYNSRETLLAAAAGTLVASLCGSPFPTLVYVGHPGWKSVGARIGYSLATGVALLLLGSLGLLNVLLTIIPIVSILPILIYIGMVITAQAFTSVPARHAPAVALAIIPWMASWAYNQIQNALNAAGTSITAVGEVALRKAGVFIVGMNTLGQSSILVSMILCAITVYIIDKNYKMAAGYSLFASLCSFFGLIHAGVFGINMASGPATGYFIISAFCFFKSFQTESIKILASEKESLCIQIAE